VANNRQQSIQQRYQKTEVSWFDFSHVYLQHSLNIYTTHNYAQIQQTFTRWTGLCW